MKNGIGFIFLVLICCTDKKVLEDQWIREELRDKVEHYRVEKKASCREKLLESVLRDADSIMLKRAHLDRPDSLYVPEKKHRPEDPKVHFPSFEKPENRVKKDVTPVPFDTIHNK